MYAPYREVNNGHYIVVSIRKGLTVLWYYSDVLCLEGQNLFVTYVCSNDTILLYR